MTMIRPSGSIEMPGQNMSWPVFDTSVWDTSPVVRSNMDVWVRPPPPAYMAGALADHVSSRLSGSSAAAAGTIGKLMVGPQDPNTPEPPSGAGGAASPTRVISAALLQGPRPPASVMACS